MWWNYWSIPQLQQLHCGSLGMDKLFHPTLYDRCIYLSMLGMKLCHVTEKRPLVPIPWSQFICVSESDPYLWCATSRSRLRIINWIYATTRAGLYTLYSLFEWIPRIQSHINKEWSVIYEFTPINHISIMQPFVPVINRHKSNHHSDYMDE